jgi:hypothetical protein
VQHRRAGNGGLFFLFQGHKIGIYKGDRIFRNGYQINILSLSLFSSIPKDVDDCNVLLCKIV